MLSLVAKNAKDVGIGLHNSGVLPHGIFPLEADYPAVKIWLMDGSETGQ